jgi:hypothetical protein
MLLRRVLRVLMVATVSRLAVRVQALRVQALTTAV